ncbi:related to amino acid transporters [Phialocephala subalpina]|uniref:Related to amino acid transporters n=1 Tax=Phialocephala subalpina TaxID=576137 RepID=A0A1L7XX62_9HELO|nr:related to amino acid transporters [Phialocephala subalpina]
MAENKNAPPDLEKTVSRHSHIVAPPPELLSGDADAELLAKLGYKQELRRNFTMIEVFGIAFSIMGLLPSIASTLSFSIPAGPVGMVWGWFVASMFIFVVGVAMADLGSAMPTSGGLYWWTRNALSFLVGYSNTLGLVGVPRLLNSIVISRDGNWTPTNGDVYAVFLGCVLLHGVLASTLSKIMGKLQTVFVAMNLILIAATIIALPIGKHQRNDAHYIFAQTENLTTWPTGWAFMLSWLSPIWTIGAFDSCVHMSEEAANAAKAVPYGILMSIGSCWILGFIIMIVIAACINPDLESVLGSSFGQPMAQIYYDAIGKHDMGILPRWRPPVLELLPRHFSEDGIHPSPLRLGLRLPGRNSRPPLPHRPSSSSSALLSRCGRKHVAWGTPLFCRLVWGQHKFVPGPFYTGDKLSRPIAWLAITFLVFGIILAMFPVGGPNPTPQDMNYTVVINMAVWGGALAYYFIDARKWFTGPKITVDVGAMTDEQRQTLADEGLEITVNEGDTTPEYGGGVRGDKIEKGVESA